MYDTCTASSRHYHHLLSIECLNLLIQNCTHASSLTTQSPSHSDKPTLHLYNLYLYKRCFMNGSSTIA